MVDEPRYVRTICLTCLTTDLDVTKTRCTCGGPVPLVHAEDTPSGRDRVNETIQRLKSDKRFLGRQRKRFVT